MKRYTLFFVCCFIALIAASTVFAQGFTGPGTNSPTPSGPGYAPPSPPPVGPGAYPPSPPSPPRGGPGAYPPAPPSPGGPGAYPPPAPYEGTSGQYGYTGQVRTVTIEQAKTFAHRTPVVITGTIVQAIGGDFYTFRDSSGEITLKIGPREWYMLGTNIGPSDRIEISGEIHWPPHSWQNIPELHARYIRKI